MKKLKRKEAQGYFTLEMLDRDFIVRNGTEGIDPDLSDSLGERSAEYRSKEKTWLNKHPEISNERKEKMRELGLKSIASIQKLPSHPSVLDIVSSKGVIAHPDTASPLESVQNGGSRYD